MIIIINGPCGIGKTSTAWALNELFDRAVMLDGDFIGAVHPMEIHDPQRVAYLYKTLAHLVGYHRREGGYRNFVINYVFEEPSSLTALKDRLAEFDGRIHAFRLVATNESIEARIRGRETEPGELAWYLNRYKELVAIQETAAQQGDLGAVIDTTERTVSEVATEIFRLAHG